MKLLDVLGGYAGASGGGPFLASYPGSSAYFNKVAYSPMRPSLPSPQFLAPQAPVYEEDAFEYDLSQTPIISTSISPLPHISTEISSTAKIEEDKYSEIKTALPWLEDILTENGTITLPQGKYNKIKHWFYSIFI